MIMREYGEGENRRILDEDDSRESTPAAKKAKKAGNKLVESLKVPFYCLNPCRILGG